MTTDELVPHVDQDDQVLGVITRQQAYSQGLRHRGVHGLFFNTQGRLLVQQRSWYKPTWPGLYDLSAAETLQPDESYAQALIRGAAEELGVVIELQDLEQVGETYYQEYHWQDYQLHGNIQLFTAQIEQTPQVTDGEVEQLVWMMPDEVTQAHQTEPEKYTPWFKTDWQKFLDQN